MHAGRGCAGVRWPARGGCADGKVHVLYRAEDSVGTFKGTSRIGLAVSHDGFEFAVTDAVCIALPQNSVGSPESSMSLRVYSLSDRTLRSTTEFWKDEYGQVIVCLTPVSLRYVEKCLRNSLPPSVCTCLIVLPMSCWKRR